MGAEARIKELGITLPSPPKPMGNYIPAVRVGNLLFLSGHGPIRASSGGCRDRFARRLLA